MRKEGTDFDSRCARLLVYLRDLQPEVRTRLAHLKAQGAANRSRPDFLWYLMLTSFATMGNSRGYDGLMADGENLRSLSYNALAALDSGARNHAIESGLRKAKVRMPALKAKWLAANFLLIERMGGLSQANTAAFAQRDRAAKIAFLKQFAGIGDKYARNIWMDVYDAHFYDAIAIDQRIKNVTAALGLSFRHYADHERFYQSLATKVGLQLWELDRVVLESERNPAG